jgi:hypothetical protein
LVKRQWQDVSKKYLNDEIGRKLTDLQLNQKKQPCRISPPSSKIDKSRFDFNSLLKKLSKIGSQVEID